MEKEKIIIDVDYVICDCGFLPLINQFMGTDYKIEDFKEYYIDDILGSDENKQKFYDFYYTKNCYTDAVLKPNAYDVLKRLNKKYDIFICSACVNFAMPERSGKFFKDKYDYLIKELPFLDPNKFIFTNAKDVVYGDYIIDDRLSNLKGNTKNKYLYTAYHNINISDEELKKENVKRVDSWDDIADIFE